MAQHTPPEKRKQKNADQQQRPQHPEWPLMRAAFFMAFVVKQIFFGDYASKKSSCVNKIQKID